MNARTNIAQGPVALSCQALDVCTLVCNSGMFKHEHLKVTTKTLLRLVEDATGNLCRMSQEEDRNRKLDMSEDCSVDLLNAIGLASLLISALDSESFEPDGPDLHGLDAVHTLLMLCKSEVDNHSSQLMAQIRAEQPENEQATYMAGVALGVELLKAGDSFNGVASDATDLEADVRGNVPQHNFARPFIEAVATSPDLIEGFSAVLSGHLGVETPPDTEVVARLTYENIMGAQAVAAKPARKVAKARKAVAA